MVGGLGTWLPSRGLASITTRAPACLYLRSQVRWETVLWGWSTLAMTVKLVSKCVGWGGGCKTTCYQALSRLAMTYLEGGELDPAGFVCWKH